MHNYTLTGQQYGGIAIIEFDTDRRAINFCFVLLLCVINSAAIKCQFKTLFSQIRVRAKAQRVDILAIAVCE